MAAARARPFSCWPSAISVTTTARMRSRPRTGIEAPTIRRIAAELAQAAFADRWSLDQPWTDAWGRRHRRMVGRPVAMHAMRGISAHSNGFHTCRALHLLQILLGTIDAPGGFRYKPPFPKPIPPAPKPAGKPDQVAPGRPLPGPPLGFPTAPRICWSTADGSPCRIDKAFSWDAPLAAHGLMHLVIANARQPRSVPDRHAVHVHGEHGLELGDEHGRDARRC